MSEVTFAGLKEKLAHNDIAPNHEARKCGANCGACYFERLEKEFETLRDLCERKEKDYDSTISEKALAKRLKEVVSALLGRRGEGRSIERYLEDLERGGNPG